MLAPLRGQKVNWDRIWAWIEAEQKPNFSSLVNYRKKRWTNVFSRWVLCRITSNGYNTKIKRKQSFMNVMLPIIFNSIWNYRHLTMAPISGVFYRSWGVTRSIELVTFFLWCILRFLQIYTRSQSSSGSFRTWNPDRDLSSMAFLIDNNTLDTIANPIVK